MFGWRALDLSDLDLLLYCESVGADSRLSEELAAEGNDRLSPDLFHPDIRLSWSSDSS